MSHSPAQAARAVLYLVALCALLCASASGLIDALRRKPLQDFAAAIEIGRVPKTLNDDFKERAWQLVRANGSICQRTTSLSRITVALFLLRNTNDRTRSDAFHRFQTVVHAGLACNPLDGNVWLLGAMTDFYDGDYPGVAHSWAQSIRTTPFEGRVVAARWEIAPGLLASGVLPLTKEVEADLSTLVRHADAKEVARVIWQLQEVKLSTLAQQALATLPPKRRTAIDRQLARWATPVDAAPKKSPFRSDQSG